MYYDVPERENSELLFPLVGAVSTTTTSSSSSPSSTATTTTTTTTATPHKVKPRRRYNLRYKSDVVKKVEAAMLAQQIPSHVAVDMVANELGISPHTIDHWTRPDMKHKIEQFVCDKTFTKRRKKILVGSK